MKNKFVIGYYNLANFVTLTGLVCAVLACFVAASGNFFLSMLCLSLAALCDATDGRIARANPSATKRSRFYGVQLDSLCDMVSFGVVPCMIAYLMGYNGVIDIILYLLFGVCGATRLANFNTEAAVDSADLKMNHFTGVPIPFSAMILPLLVIVHMLAGHLALLFRIAFLVVGLGYILRVRIPKPSGKAQLIMGVYMLACVIALLVIQLVK